MKKTTSVSYIHQLMQKIKPGMAYKEDFQSWQPAAKAKLAELLGLDRFEKVEPQTEIEYEQKLDGATEICFSFYSEEGYAVPCHG